MDYGRTYSTIYRRSSKSKNEEVKNSDVVIGSPHHSQKSVPLFLCIPIKNPVIPILYVLFGLGDYLIDFLEILV